MKASHLVQCFTSHTHTFVCVSSSGVLITLCRPYYQQLSLWAPCLHDSVLTIVLQPIIFQIPGLESQLTVVVFFGKLKLLANFISDFLSMLYNFLLAIIPQSACQSGYNCAFISFLSFPCLCTYLTTFFPSLFPSLLLLVHQSRTCHVLCNKLLTCQRKVTTSQETCFFSHHFMWDLSRPYMDVLVRVLLLNWNFPPWH